MEDNSQEVAEESGCREEQQLFGEAQMPATRGQTSKVDKDEDEEGQKKKYRQQMNFMTGVVLNLKDFIYIYK